MTDTEPGAHPGNPGDAIALRFWGVRGSLPTPGPATVRYGGNTLCVEVRCGAHLLILDAGSGARELGATLGPAADADILLSHTHLDHICGLPFFAPMYDPRAKLRFWGGHLAPPDGIGAALTRSWQAPLMPDLDKAFRAQLTFRDFPAGQELAPHPGLRVGTLLLRHPGNAIGYRVTWGGANFCYITDTEHPAEGLDTDLVRFVSGTDTLIYDASFTEDEYKTRIGWGHSTWRAAADVADAASVGRLVLFHHDPGHDDSMMDEIAQTIAVRRPGSLVATEGMRLTIG